MEKKKRWIILGCAGALLLVLAALLISRSVNRLTPWQGSFIKPDPTAVPTASPEPAEGEEAPEATPVPSDMGDMAPLPEGDESGYTILAAENDRYRLLANEKGNICVEDKQTGTKYESNPMEKDPLAVGINMTNMNSQLYITFASEGGSTTTKNSTTDCVNKEWLSFTAIENGIRYRYDFQNAGIVIPLEYVLEEDGLRVSIPVDDIEEGAKEQYLTDVALLPYFGAAGADSTGYTLVPDGSGALIRHNNDKAIYGAYRQSVYGRDTALVTNVLTAPEQSVRMPVFGLQNGRSGFTAIITEGDTVATVNAMTGGTITSYNNVYASFRYRPFTMGTFYQGNAYAHDGVGDSQQTLMLPSVNPVRMNFTVKYVLQEKEGLSYVDMAAAYRQYLIREQGLAPRVQAGEAPFYLEILGGIVKDQVVLGVRLPMLQKLTGFSEAQELIELLRAGGIKDMAVKMTGWQDGGMEAKIPSVISFEGKLGGKKGYQALKQYADEAGIDLFMDFDFVNFYRGGNGLSTFTDSVQTIEKTPTYLYTYNYNTLEKINDDRWHLLTPRMSVAALQHMLTDLDALEGAQLSLSTFGDSIYSDFTNKQNGLDRANTRALWQDALQMADEATEKLMVDAGNAYALPYVSHVYGAPLSCTLYNIEDTAVPFYQIVLHGLVSYSTEPVNLSSNPEKLVLQALETGSSLSACLMTAENHVLSDTRYNGVYSGNYEAWTDILTQAYAGIAPILADVAAEEIVGHAEVAPNVFRTVYGNGAAVYVNYGSRAVSLDGRTIEAMGFAYVPGEEARQ